jgi:hypothetical protein
MTTCVELDRLRLHVLCCHSNVSIHARMSIRRISYVESRDDRYCSNIDYRHIFVVNANRTARTCRVRLYLGLRALFGMAIGKSRTVRNESTVSVDIDRSYSRYSYHRALFTSSNTIDRWQDDPIVYESSSIDLSSWKNHLRTIDESTCDTDSIISNVRQWNVVSLVQCREIIARYCSLWKRVDARAVHQHTRTCQRNVHRWFHSTRLETDLTAWESSRDQFVSINWFRTNSCWTTGIARDLFNGERTRRHDTTM